MKAALFHNAEVRFEDHPKFAGVRIAKCVDSARTQAVSVSFLDIGAGVEIPVHTHDLQVDSIYVVSGNGKAFVNGEWQNIEEGHYIFVPAAVEHGIRNTGKGPLRLFVHHSPPLF